MRDSEICDVMRERTRLEENQQIVGKSLRRLHFYCYLVRCCRQFKKVLDLGDLEQQL